MKSKLCDSLRALRERMTVVQVISAAGISYRRASKGVEHRAFMTCGHLRNRRLKVCPFRSAERALFPLAERDILFTKESRANV
jgi:hypothetical protein